MVVLIFHKVFLSPFSNDTLNISIKYLVELIQERGWVIDQLYKVTRYDSDTTHYVAVLASGHTVCDCMMGINLGIPCRHFYAVSYTTNAVMFHLSMVNKRFVKILYTYTSHLHICPQVAH